VDKRKEPRFETSYAIRLTILGSSAGVPDKVVPACIINLSGRGLSLTTEAPVPVGSAVRIDIDDNMLLGEVCHLNQTGPASFTCGVHLEQALTAVNDLSRLIAGIMGESRTESRPNATDSEEAVALKKRRHPTGLLSRL
jgi:hypothetical protein